MATGSLSCYNDPFKAYDLSKWTNDAERESANLDTFLKEEFIKITFNLEAKSMYTFTGIGYHLLNEKTVAKYSKFCANVEFILQAFQSSYIVESGFNHMNHLHFEHKMWWSGLKHINLQLNIRDLFNTYQTHPCH